MHIPGLNTYTALATYILNTPQSPESPSAPISPRPALPPVLDSLDALSSAAISSPRPRTSRVSDGSMIPSSCSLAHVTEGTKADVPISLQSNMLPRSELLSLSVSLSTYLHLRLLACSFQRLSA
jgi:hypothetical protein